MPILICKRVTFYSENDELIFFEWVSRIKAISRYEGVRDEIRLHVPRTSISDTSLRDLTAIFYRYKIDMTQLRIFLSEKNKNWYYSNTKAYWHKRVFGKVDHHDLFQHGDSDQE